MAKIAVFGANHASITTKYYCVTIKFPRQISRVLFTIIREVFNKNRVWPAQIRDCLDFG